MPHANFGLRVLCRHSRTTQKVGPLRNTKASIDLVIAPSGENEKCARDMLRAYLNFWKLVDAANPKRRLISEFPSDVFIEVFKEPGSAQ